MRDFAEMYDKPQLEQWYLRDHLTLEEIGKKLSITRQAVHNRMRRCGIDMSTGERFDVKCDVCGVFYSVTRKRFKSTIMHLCSEKCRIAYLKTSQYKASRQGQRIGRAVLMEIATKKGLSMPDGFVVHHKDGDDFNNDPSNLMVFKNNAEHTLHHHKLRRERLSNV